MANHRKLEFPTLRNIYVEGSTLKEIKVLDPSFNLSAECNALLEEKLKLLKKEEAPVDPINILGLGSKTEDVVNNDYRQTQLFQYLDVKDVRTEVIKLVNTETDMKKLDTLQRNCQAIVMMVTRRKEENAAIARAKLRNLSKSPIEVKLEIQEIRRKTGIH